MHARAVHLQSLTVQAGAIAFMFLETVFGMRETELRHHAVARDFRDNGCCGNRSHDAVAADHGFDLTLQRQCIPAIDENELWCARQPTHGLRQRPEACAKDIVAVDPRRRRNRDRDLSNGANFFEQFFAARGRKLFRVVETVRHAGRIKDHRRRYYRPGKRSPARFIATRNWRTALAIRLSLVNKGGAAARRNHVRNFTGVRMFECAGP